MFESQASMLRAGAIAALALACGAWPPALAAQDPDAPDETTVCAEPPDGVTAEMVALGARLFESEAACAACHGQAGAGTALAPRLTDDELIHDDSTYDAIVARIRSGVPEPEEHPAPMPPMGGADLTDEQVRAVAAYVLSLCATQPDADPA